MKSRDTQSTRGTDTSEAHGGGKHNVVSVSLWCAWSLCLCLSDYFSRLGIARFRSAGELSHRLPIPEGPEARTRAKGDRQGELAVWIPSARTLTTQRENGKTCTRPQLQVSVANVRSGTHELGAAAAAEQGREAPPRIKRFYTFGAGRVLFGTAADGGGLKLELMSSIRSWLNRET